MRQEQYMIKASYRRPIYFLRAGRGSQKIDWDDNIWMDEDGEIKYEGRCTLFNPNHVSAMLCNYHQI